MNKRQLILRRRIERPSFDPDLTLYYNFAVQKNLVTVDVDLGPTLDITRTTSTASYFDSSGVLQNASAGVARFDHLSIPPFTSLGLLVEGARTNLAIRSGDISNVAWVAANMTKGTTSVTDPTGMANANVRLTASAPNGTLLQTVTSAIDDYSYAVFMKRVTGTGDIDLTVDNGVTWTTKTLTSDWLRFDVSDASETNPVFGVRIVTSGDAIDFWGSDLNKNTIFPTSHIPTVAASVTRNADVVKTTDVSWYNVLGGTLYMAASEPYVTELDSYTLDLSDNSASDRILFQRPSTDDQAFLTAATGNDASLSITDSWDTANTTVRTAVAFAANDAELYVNGARSGTGDQTVVIPTGITDLDIGSGYDDANLFNGHIQELRYYNVRKNNQFLEDLSNGLISA